MADTPEQPPSAVPPSETPENASQPAKDGASIDAGLIAEGLVHPASHGFCSDCGNQLPPGGTTIQCDICAQKHVPTETDATTAPKDLCCCDCGYALAGLPRGRDCPECSTSYAKSLEFHGKPRPDQQTMAMRLFWPVGLGLISFLLFILAQTGLFGFITVIAILINAVNLPVLSSSYSSNFVPRHRRGRWAKNMFFLGPWVGAAWVVGAIAIVATVVLPVLFFGACVIFAASGGFR